MYLLGDDLPTEGKELSYFSDRALVAKAGDYVYDPATKDYYEALQNLNKPADWSEGASFNSGALVRRPSNGLLYSANKDLNGTQNTEADFANNWTLASTWVEGVAVNEGDTVYKDGNLYSAKQSISAADNSAANLVNPTFWTPPTVFPILLFPLRTLTPPPYFCENRERAGQWSACLGAG